MKYSINKNSSELYFELKYGKKNSGDEKHLIKFELLKNKYKDACSKL